MKTQRFMLAAAATSNIAQERDVKRSWLIWLNHVAVCLRYAKINSDVKQSYSQQLTQ